MNSSNPIIFDKIIALTGSGISKASGIPTFEDRPGLRWKLSRETKEVCPALFWEAYHSVFYSIKDKEPNAAHFALAEYNIPIITMNVDSLHQKAGSKEVYELHGSYENNDVVLYGDTPHYMNEAEELIEECAGRKAALLVIGSSMQTVYANELVNLAMELGMYVKFINGNAEEKVGEWLGNHGQRTEK